MRRSGWTAGVVLGALLVAGCGADGGSASPAREKPSSPSKSPNGAAAPTGSAASAGAGASPAASGASPGATGAFGKEQAAADVVAATTAAGLPQPEADATAFPSPTGVAADVAGRRAELLACMVPWQTMERVEDPEKAYTATIAELERLGWKAGGDPFQENMLSQVSLKKQGWVLFARRYDFSAGKGSGTGMPDMLSFFASDLACEGRFTEAEMEEAFKDESQE
ncbi:hypothetical protein [Streptomyces sp. NBC_01264]|uniref:hypothetical protein n=1 Tax=Streptomyces sp. NBC_01264 TaxID=2903804 RepID=UPI0022547359|nr:hypothetical protein [Streptomyces sp. NBC_01264]MCX4778077.1 hypothetical protein [Streptomyces sp. NBC_01264]